eukprot:572234_1
MAALNLCDRLIHLLECKEWVDDDILPQNEIQSQLDRIPNPEREAKSRIDAVNKAQKHNIIGGLRIGITGENWEPDPETCVSNSVKDTFVYLKQFQRSFLDTIHALPRRAVAISTFQGFFKIIDVIAAEYT